VYDQDTGCLKNVNENDSNVSSIGSNDDDFVKELLERFNISSGNEDDKGDKFDLNLSFMLEDKNPKNQHGDSKTVGTFRDKDKVIEINSSDKEEEPVNDKEDEVQKKVKGSSKQLKSEKEMPKDESTEAIHGTMSVDTSQTKETSTLSDSTANPEQNFARMCLQNPDLLAQFLKSNPDIKTVPSGKSKTPSQKTDPPKASPQEEGDEVS
jgi:hypothetical protein